MLRLIKPMAVLAAFACVFLEFCIPQGSIAGKPLQATIPVTALHTGPVIVGCVGDSITAGVGSSSADHNFPSLLGDLLGPGYKVINFGESGATLLKNGDSPYWKRGSFATSAAANPDVVVIMLGTNDSKPWNWKLKDQFASDYSGLIDYYASLPSHPLIFDVLPPPVPGAGNYGINEPAVEEQIPIIEQVAAAKKDEVIDVHSGMPDDSKYFADNVHPNDDGYILLASSVYFGLTHAPVIEPIADRSFTGTETVTIVPPDSDDVVRYTIDGSIPNRKSPIYSAPLTITSTTTVNAQVFKGKKSSGLVSTAVFTLTQ